MSDAAKRISRWESKVTGPRYARAYSAQGTTMAAAARGRFLAMYQIEQLVKGVLASEDAVTVLDSPSFQAFAREIYGLQRRFPGGAQLNNDVALRLAKWKGRGLSEAVLIRVRNEVFSVPPPAAP